MAGRLNREALDGRARDGRAVHQHDSNALDGRRAGGQLGSPRDADGDGAHGVHGVATLPPVRPGGSDLANRDRFVLSIGHASMLLYSMLHLCGVKAVDAEYERLGEPSVTLDDIKRFRQLGSKCPGHPEYRWTSGVETTTGPLGQGVATSVGMAIAARWQAAHFNRPGFDLFDYDVYALCGDGCMMEGVASEAASLAGHLRLANLCWIYDNNHITIEGSTALAFSDDVATRFLGYGWNVSRVGDANDLGMLTRALSTFTRTSDRPTLIIVDSHIGYGAPHKQDTSAAHGEPLGDGEVALAKRSYGWPEEAKFLVRDDVTGTFTTAWAREVVRRGWNGKPGSASTRRGFPILPIRLHGCSVERCPTAGTTICRSPPRVTQGCRAATRPVPC